MDRREAIRTLGAAVALPVVGGASSPARALAYEARMRLSGGPYRPRTLTPHQDRTVTSVAELIIPETETPGAEAALVNEFIDLILTEWFDSAQTARFLNGLSTLDADARVQHGSDFAELEQTQQIQMLQRLDDELQELVRTSDGASAALDPVAAPAGAAGEGPDPSQHFFYQMKRLTLTGYFTSEVGMKQELDYQVIPGRYDGCADRG